MRGLTKLMLVELKLFLREPGGTFFTLIFPLIMLLLFGSIYGNEPTPFFGGFGSVDVSVPAYTGVIIATSGLMSLTILMAVYRERGILRRFRTTPLRPWTLLLAETGVVFAMTAAGMLLLIICGKLVYGLRFAGNAANILIAFVLCSMSFFSLGFVLAGILPTARSAQVVAMALFFPMIFLSGATIPREVLPEAVRHYGQILPLTHVVNLLRGLWVGESWSQHWTEALVLVALFAVCIPLSAKTFRWE